MVPSRRANESEIHLFAQCGVVGVIVMIIVLFEPTNLDQWGVLGGIG